MSDDARNEPSSAPVGGRFRPWAEEMAAQIAAERDAARRFAAIDPRWRPLADHLTRVAFAAHQVLAYWDIVATYGFQSSASLVHKAAVAAIETSGQRYTENREAESFLLASVRQYGIDAPKAGA